MSFSLPLASAGMAMEYFLHLIASPVTGLFEGNSNKDLLSIKRQDFLSRHIGCSLTLEAGNHASSLGPKEIELKKNYSTET